MINYEYPPIGGGSGNATAHLLEALRGYPELEIDLLTSGVGSKLEWRNLSDTIRIALLPIEKKDLHFWTGREIAAWWIRAWAFARRLTASRSYDLCHCWSGWPSGVIGHLLRRRQPYLVALRGSDVPGYSARLALLDRLVLRALSRRVWKGASAVTALSHQLLDLARSTLPGLSARVVYNGVDSQKFTPGEHEVETFTLLFVGRLIQRKGIQPLLEGFARLVERSPACRLVVVGGGPDQPLAEELVERLGIARQTRLVGGVPHDRLPDFYRDASVFVLPSIHEAQSNVLLEAMASGLPTITTRTGAAELIEACGIVIDELDPQSICEAALVYRSNPEMRARHGANARTRAESLTWDETARQYVEIYRQALGSENGPSNRAVERQA